MTASDSEHQRLTETGRDATATGREAAETGGVYSDAHTFGWALAASEPHSAVALPVA